MRTVASGRSLGKKVATYSFTTAKKNKKSSTHTQGRPIARSIGRLVLKGKATIGLRASSALY